MALQESSSHCGRTRRAVNCPLQLFAARLGEHRMMLFGSGDRILFRAVPDVVPRFQAKLTTKQRACLSPASGAVSTQTKCALSHSPCTIAVVSHPCLDGSIPLSAEITIQPCPFIAGIHSSSCVPLAKWSRMCANSQPAGTSCCNFSIIGMPKHSSNRNFANALTRQIYPNARQRTCRLHPPLVPEFRKPSQPLERPPLP